jgi:hypothetical protein
MSRIILDFVAGCWDGVSLSSDSPDAHEAKLAQETYARTGDGTISRQIVMPCRYGFGHGAKGNKNVVTDRTEFEDEDLVRLECFSPQDTEHCELTIDAKLLIKRVVLRFEGGCLEGTVLDSYSPDDQESFACLACYLATEQATVGNGWLGVPAAIGVRGRAAIDGRNPSVEGKQYRVIAREEDDARVLATLAYLAPEPL